jgi:hypothetical protein
MLLNPLIIYPVIRKQKMLDTVEQSHICANFWFQVDRGKLGGVGQPWVNNNDLRRTGSRQTVQNTSPKYRLCRSHVVTTQHNAVGIVNVSIRARLTITSE